MEAPSGAPAAEAQPDFMANRVANPNPTIEDFVQAYQPVSKALDYAFETRITKDNAQKVQWNLAIVRLLPLLHMHTCLPSVLPDPMAPVAEGSLCMLCLTRYLLVCLYWGFVCMMLEPHAGRLVIS